MHRFFLGGGVVTLGESVSILRNDVMGVTVTIHYIE